MSYPVRPSIQGGDRRHGRSLAEILEEGNRQIQLMGPREAPDAIVTGTEYHDTDDASYDESSGPRDPKKNTRRPVEGEWDPYDIYDVYNEKRGFNK